VARLKLDYPIRRPQLQDALRRASLKRIDEDERREVPSIGPTGSSPAVTQLNRMIDQVAGFDTTVLILGESGTGKEVVARTIHERSKRAGKPFVAINCGAIPPDLLESELFGHEKGAFTGALTQRKGRFEMAEGGTLLLDEIGDMPMAMQVKLLRVLQERTFERVGGTQVYACNVRVIAATHRNLETQIANGGFREDLFYRLNVFPIEMPALRERADDLPELIAAITRQLADSGRGRVSLTGETVNALKHYHWPGNVRELHNLLERLAVLHPNAQVRVTDLPARYRAGVPDAPAMPAAAPASPPARAVAAEQERAPAVATDPSTLGPRATLPPQGIDLKGHMAELELELIQAALQQANGVVAHAAPLLGLRRTTLVEKLRKYGIERDSD
jgi:sigma-54 dependent transcriptional regulator, flagellar regulatory protein